jgi:hypothetical protein
MVSNTVGIATMQYNNQDDTSSIKSLHISWGQQNDGTPTAIFQTSNNVASNFMSKGPGDKGRPRPNFELKKPPNFWVFSGVAVVNVKYSNRQNQPLNSGGVMAGLSSSTALSTFLQPFGSKVTKSTTSGLTGTPEISVKAVILGALVHSAVNNPLMSPDGALAFQTLSSALFVVNNPNEAPSQWEYLDRYIISVPTSGTYMWYGLSPVFAAERGE